MSPTHNTSGAGAVKSPCTRSEITGGVASGVVVRTQRGGRRPRSPAAAINRATRFRPTSWPCARSSASTRGTPYCPPDAARIAPITPLRAPSPALPPHPPPPPCSRVGGRGGPPRPPPTPAPRIPPLPPPAPRGGAPRALSRKKVPPPLRNPPPPARAFFPPPQPPQLLALLGRQPVALA